MSANPTWSDSALPPLTPTLVTEPPVSPAPPLSPDPAPVAPAPAPAPELAPAAHLEPAPPAVEPPVAAPARHRILVRLDSGEQIEVAAHADAAAARAEATTLMRYLRDGRGDWPFVGDRFVRPERIVSVDVE